MLSSAEISPPEPRPRRAPTLFIIAGIKLIKGLLLLAAALGILALVGNDLPDDFQRLLHWLGLDPEQRFLVSIGIQLDQITPANLRWTGILTGVYGLVSLVECIGLVFRISWVGWLVIGESAFFIPIEIRELVAHPHWFVLGVLALNGWIVWYLFANRQRLFRHYRPH